MKMHEYYKGRPNAKYGVFNVAKKEWQFNIAEDTPMLAEARLHQYIGVDARKWKFHIRKLED